MKSGTFVVGPVQEGLDLAQAGVRIARVPQDFIAPGGLLLADGQKSPATRASWSLWRDVQICFQTIPAVLTSRGAR